MLADIVTFNLKQINLSNNVLEEDGVRAVNEYLWENTTLEILKLNNTKLEDKSCKMLA